MGGGPVAGHRHGEDVLGQGPDVVLKGGHALLEQGAHCLRHLVVRGVARAEVVEDGEGLLENDEYWLLDRIS